MQLQLSTPGTVERYRAWREKSSLSTPWYGGTGSHTNCFNGFGGFTGFNVTHTWFITKASPRGSAADTVSTYRAAASWPPHVFPVTNLPRTASKKKPSTS